MTTVEEVVMASPAGARRATIEERRATIIGFVLLALAALVLIAFAFGVDSEAEAELGLSLPGDRFQGLQWVFHPRTLSIVVGVVLAALGAQRLTRRQLQKTNLVLGIGLGLFTLSFLAWAAADGSFSMVGMLRSTVTSAVVIVLGALCGIMCERAGVINIGIEGQLLTSAFVAVILSSAFGTIAGVLGAMAVAGLLGWALAWFSIRFRVDQIITGVVINIFSLGLTSFLASRVLSQAQDLNAPARVPSFRIPLLADIPVIGPMFFDHHFFVYGMLILVVALHVALFRTRWGHGHEPSESIPRRPILLALMSIGCAIATSSSGG